MDICTAFGIREGYMVSLVGGGGKTSAMFRLANELRQKNLRVLAGTTTAIFYPEKRQYDKIHIGEDLATLAQPLPGTVTVLGSAVTPEGKLLGVASARLDALYERNLFNVMLIEADGSKRRPIKAPAAHEPVVPPHTGLLIGVIGFDCFGKPIDENYVHRPELLAKIAGKAQGGLIDAEVIEALVLSPEGLFKNCPQSAQKVLFFNKAGNAENRRRAEAIGRSLLQKKPDLQRVLVGNILEDVPLCAVLQRHGDLFRTEH